MHENLSAIAESKSPLADLIGDLDERPCKTIPWPRRPDRSVSLWELTQSEGDAARKRAFEYVRDILKFSELDLAWDEQRAIYDAIAVETLAVALRKPENPKVPFARDAQQLRDRVSPHTLEALFSEYLTFVKQQHPLADVQDPEKELEELVSLVGKGYPIAARLTSYDITAARELLRTAVGQLASAQTENSSDTSLQNDSLP